MSESPTRILDYSHFVEVVDQEEMGCFSRYPRGVLEAVESVEIGDKGQIRFYPGDLGRQVAQYYNERRELFGQDQLHDQCRYCEAEMEVVHKDHRRINAVFGRIDVRVCRNCGWWESSDECALQTGEDNWYRSKEIRRRGLLREFSVGGSEVPLESLRRHLAKHPQQLTHVSPYRLEELVGKVFGEVMDCESIHLGGPNDGGIDLVLIRGDTDYVVQVKRRESPVKAEPVRGIREFLGAMLLHGSIRGIYVSTAPRFSRSAQHAATEAQRLDLVERIELVDGRRLADVCRLAELQASPPWERFITTATDPPPEFPEDHTYVAFPVQ